MSFNLDLLCGKDRLQECAKTDPPGQLNFLEQTLLEQDRAYLQSQEERAARRMLEAMELERSYFSRMGWGF